MYKFNDKTYTTEALSNIASVKGYSLDELLAKNPSIVLEENAVDDENTDESGKPTGVQEKSNVPAAPVNTVSDSENTSLDTPTQDKPVPVKELLKLPKNDWKQENWDEWIVMLENEGSKEAKEKIKEYKFAKENYLIYNPQGKKRFELVEDVKPSDPTQRDLDIASGGTSSVITMANALVAGENGEFFEEQNYRLTRTPSFDFGRQRYQELYEKNYNLEEVDPIDDEWMRSYRDKRKAIADEDADLESVYLTNQKELLQQASFESFLRPTLTNTLNGQESDELTTSGSFQDDEETVFNRSNSINTNSLASLNYLSRPDDGSLLTSEGDSFWQEVEMPSGFGELIEGLRSGEIKEVSQVGQEDGFFDDEVNVVMKDGTTKSMPVGDIGEFNDAILKAYNAPQNQWILDGDANLGGQKTRFNVLKSNYDLLNEYTVDIDDKKKLNNLVKAENIILDEEDIIAETYLKGEYKKLHEELKPIQDQIRAIGLKAKSNEDFRNADANRNNIQDWVEQKQKLVESYNQKRSELDFNSSENWDQNRLKSTPKLYDLTTGQFIDKNKASKESIEINNGINFAAQTLSFNSEPADLERARHDAMSEVVYLGGQLLKVIDRYSEDMSMGDQIAGAFVGGYDPESDIDQIVDRKYLFEKLREMYNTGIIPEGLVLAEGKNNLAAQRYNKALQDFMVINKALELNIDERKLKTSHWTDYLAAGTRDVMGTSNISEPNEIIKAAMEGYQRFGIMPDYDDIYTMADIDNPGYGERFLRAAPGIIEMAGKFYLAGGAVSRLSSSAGMTEGLGSFITTGLNQTKMGRSMFGRRWTQMMGMGVQEAATIGGYNMMSSDEQDINYAFVLGSAPINSLYKDFLKYSHGLSLVKPDKISNMLAKGFQRNPLTATGVRQLVAPAVSTVAIAGGGQVESLVLGEGVNLNALSFESLSDTYLQMFFLKNINPQATIGEWKTALMKNLAKKSKTSTEVIKSLKQTDLVPEGKKTLTAEDIDALDPLEIEKSKERGVNEILGKGEETVPSVLNQNSIERPIFNDARNIKSEKTMDYSGPLNDGFKTQHPVTGKTIIVNEAQLKKLEKLNKAYNNITGFKTYQTILNMEDALNGLNTYINDESVPMLMRMESGNLTATDIDVLGSANSLNEAFSAKFKELNPSPNVQGQVDRVLQTLKAQQPVFEAIVQNARLFPKGEKLGEGGKRNTFINLSYGNAQLRGKIASIEAKVKAQDKLNGGASAADKLEIQQLKETLVELEAKEMKMLTVQKAINNLKVERAKKLSKEYTEDIGGEEMEVEVLGPKEFSERGDEYKPKFITDKGEMIIEDVVDVDKVKGSKGLVMSSEGEVYMDGKKVDGKVSWKEGVSVDGGGMIINEMWAKKINAPTVFTHEITHKITDKAWNNISKESQDKIVEGFVENIKGDIDPLTFIKLKNTVEKHNGGKTFNENPNTVEWINIFHDMVGKNEITFEKNKGLFKSLGSTIERVLGTGKSEFENMDWSNPKHVYDFIKDFSITTEKGKKSDNFIQEFKRLKALENDQYLSEDVELETSSGNYSATTNPQKLALSLIPKSKAKAEPQEVAKVQTMLVEGVPSIGINKGFKDMSTKELMEARDKLKNFNINNKEADISVKKDNSLGIQSINKLLSDPQNAVNVLSIEGKQRVADGDSPLTVAFEMVGSYNPNNLSALGPMGRRYVDLIKSRADDIDRRYNLPGAKKLFNTEEYMQYMFGEKQGLTSIVKTYLQGNVENTNPNGYINAQLKKRSYKAFEDHFEGEISQFKSTDDTKSMANESNIVESSQPEIVIETQKPGEQGRTIYTKSGVIDTEKLGEVQDAVVRLGMGNTTLDTKITGGSIGKGEGKQNDINNIDKTVVDKFTADIKKKMGGGNKYIDFIKNNQDLLNNIDLDVLTKFNMFPFYEAKLGADGKQIRIETVKGKSQPLQFKKKIPTIEEILSWVNAEGKAPSTKGTRKDALARAIAIRMGRDIAMDAQSSAANTGGFVPKINSKGEYTYTKYPVEKEVLSDRKIKSGDIPKSGVYFSADGKSVFVNGLERPIDGTVVKVNTNKNGVPESIDIAESYDIYRDLNPADKADAMLEGSLNSIGFRLKRDPNLKFASTTNDATGLLTISEATEQVGNLARDILNLDPSKKNKVDILEYVDINYSKLNKTLKDNDIELLNIIDDAINRSIYSDNKVEKLEGDLVEGGNYPRLAQDLNERYEKYGSGHIILNARTQSGKGSWADNPIEKAQFGNTLYGALTDVNMAGLIETQALYQSMGFGNFKIIGPDGTSKRLGTWIPGENKSEKIANAWNMPGEIGVTGEGKLPKDVDAFFIASPGKIQADPVLVKGEKVVVEIDGVKQYKYKPTSIQGFFQKLALEGKLENGRITDPADIKEYTTMLKTRLTKQGINPYTDKPYTFEETIAANKALSNRMYTSLYNQLSNVTLTPAEKKAGVTVEQKESRIANDIFSWMRMQTNIGEGIAKGSFTITTAPLELGAYVPTKNLESKGYDPYAFKRTHSEHHIPMGVVNGNVMDLMVRYKNNPKKFKQELTKLLDRAEQGIITVDAQRWADNPLNRGAMKIGPYDTDLNQFATMPWSIERLSGTNYLQPLDIQIDLRNGSPLKSTLVEEGVGNIIKPYVEEINKNSNEINEGSLENLKRIEDVNTISQNIVQNEYIPENKLEVPENPTEVAETELTTVNKIAGNPEINKVHKDSELNLQKLAEENGINYSAVPLEIQPSSAVYNQIKVREKAIEMANRTNAPKKKVYLSDIDDSLLYTDSRIDVTMPDGKTFKINPKEFNEDAGKYLLEAQQENPSYTAADLFSFGEFGDFKNAKKAKAYKVVERIYDKNIKQGKDGWDGLYFLTSRKGDMATALAFQYRLEQLSGGKFKVPLDHYIGVESSDPAAKANYVDVFASLGYNDFVFLEDAAPNTAAFSKRVKELGLTDRARPIKASSTSIEQNQFDNMIQHSSGVKADARYSDANVKKISPSGRKLLPYNTYNYQQLIQTMAGKGKQGLMDYEYVKQKSYDTYKRSVSDQNTFERNYNAGLNTVFKTYKDFNKTLNNEAFNGWTVQDAVRIQAWKQQGMEDVPGLSKRDLDGINKFISVNPDVRSMANELVRVGGVAGYHMPNSADWVMGNIQSDAMMTVNKSARKYYQDLNGYTSFVDSYYTPENLNKLEVAYGTKYRVALEDMLRRMKSGSNRPIGDNFGLQGLNNIVNQTTTAQLALNVGSAVRQGQSNLNYMFEPGNTPWKAGKAFAHQGRYWRETIDLYNSDYLKSRRLGNKINISDAEITDALNGSTNKAGAILNLLLQKGLVLNKGMDSWAQANGFGTTYMMNKTNELLGLDYRVNGQLYDIKTGENIKDYKKVEGYEKAHGEAYLMWQELSSRTQQSSDPVETGSIQTKVGGKAFLSYGTTSMQNLRQANIELNKYLKGWNIESLEDIENIENPQTRKEILGKVFNYGMLQNSVYGALTSGFTSWLISDDTEEGEIEDIAWRMFNAEVDGLLTGFGVGGKILLGGKEAGVKFYNQYVSNKNGMFKDYEGAGDELLGSMPFIGQKLDLFDNAAYDLKQAEMKKNRFKSALDDPLNAPSVSAAANIIQGTTGFPAKRALYDNFKILEYMYAKEGPVLEKIGVGLGLIPLWETDQAKNEKAKKKSPNKNVFNAGFSNAKGGGMNTGW